MTRYLIRRLLGAIPLVLGVATVVFFVVNLAPGDPATRLLAPGMTAEVAEQVRANYGLDQPLLVRYVKWVGSAVRGEFGTSFSHHRPVLDVILGFLPNTLLLSGCALLLAFLVGIVLGTLQAVRQYSVLDSGASIVTLFFYSMPSFWLALMMILVFSYFAQAVWHLPVYFPASGLMSSDYADMSAFGQFVDRLHHLVLPVVSLALVLTAGIARFMRGSMLEVIRQDFVRTARAKGLPERSVIFKHALRNALLPIISLLGLYLPVLFSGTVFVEEVFGWPGMGRALVDAVETVDYPMIMGLSFFFAIMVVLGNLLADALYAAVDPRIRYE